MRSALFKAEVDGIEWEAWEGWSEGEIIWQRDCPDCDRGLLLAPVRFCPRCDHGFLTQRDDPRGAHG